MASGDSVMLAEGWTQLSRVCPESGAHCSVSGPEFDPWSSWVLGLTFRESCANCHLMGMKKQKFSRGGKMQPVASLSSFRLSYEIQSPSPSDPDV